MLEREIDSASSADLLTVDGPEVVCRTIHNTDGVGGAGGGRRAEAAREADVELYAQAATFPIDNICIRRSPFAIRLSLYTIRKAVLFSILFEIVQY